MIEAAAAVARRRPVVRVLLTPRGLAFEIAFAFATLSLCIPLLAGRYLPIQDLPQHAAAVRVLLDFHDARFAFDRYFELTLGSTQYLSVYALAWLLAHVVDALTALKIVLALSIVALPYTLRSLLAALGRPRSYALLCLPLTYNSQLLLGFLNFIAGLPLLMLGLALAVKLRRASTRSAARRSSLLLALVALLCFLTHVVPYGMLLLGVALLARAADVRHGVQLVAALIPSLVAFAGWMLTAPAGRVLVALGTGATLASEQPALAERIEELPLWLTDILPGAADNRALSAWVGVVLAVLVLGFVEFAASSTSAGLRRSKGSGGAVREVSCIAWLAPIAAVGYAVLPASSGFIWPIHARFALLTALLAIPILPPLALSARAVVAAASLLLTACGIQAVDAAFQHSMELETNGLAEVIAPLPMGRTVAGLIFDPRSRYLKFAPFLHAVAWAQLERGGAVMFTFAEFPASPFRFREDRRPPRVPPRWEWRPADVNPERDLSFYEYVLTRAARHPPSGYALVVQRDRWALWKRAVH